MNYIKSIKQTAEGDHVKACLSCGKDITATHARRKFCNTNCRVKHHYSERGVKSLGYVKFEAGERADYSPIKTALAVKGVDILAKGLERLLTAKKDLPATKGDIQELLNYHHAWNVAFAKKLGIKINTQN